MEDSSADYIPLQDMSGPRKRKTKANSLTRKSTMWSLQGRYHITRNEKFVMDRNLRTWAFLIAALGTLGVAIIIVVLLVNWDHKDHKPIETATGDILKVVNVLVSCVLVSVLFRYYMLLAKQKGDIWAFSSSVSAFWRSSLRWRFLGEIALCSIQPIPFINMWGFGDKLGLFMFLRGYMWIRVARDAHKIYRWRRDIVKSSEDLRKLDPSFGWIMVVRAMMFSHVTSVIFVFSFVTTLCAAFCIQVSEREHNPDLRTYGNAVWFTVVSMTSIGYGDIVPSSFWGRVVAMGQGVVGIVIISVMSAVVTNKMVPSWEQKYAVEWARLRTIGLQEGHNAALLIQSHWLFQHKRIAYPVFRQNVKDATKNLRAIRLARHASADRTVDPVVDRKVTDLMKQIGRQQVLLENLVKKLEEKEDIVHSVTKD